MIAEVAPLARLPRSLHFLDYTVPQNLEDSIQIGQLVTIPFRTSQTFGIVLSLKPGALTSDKPLRLKEITHIVHQVPLLPGFLLPLHKKMADMYGVNMGVMLKTALLPLKKRKLQSLVVKPFPPVHQKPVFPFFHSYKDTSEHRTVLEKLIKGTTLLLLPEVSFIEKIYSLLSPGFQEKTIIWSSDLSEKQQFENWLQIRNGEKKLIIGTRSAVFLPIPNLKNIIIDFEHHEGHKHFDQAPRFHVKDVAEMLAPQCGAKINYLSYSPSAVTYYHLHKGGIDSDKKELDILCNENTHVVDLSAERRGKNYTSFGFQVEEAILNSQNDIFLFLNRKGSATSVGCNDCGFVENCANCSLPFIYHEGDKQLHCHYCKIKKPLPLQCPRCNSVMLKLRGAGTENIETSIRKILPSHHNFSIIRIEGENSPKESTEEKPRLVVGTEAALPYIRWEKTDCVVFINIDSQLQVPEYTADEHVWQLIQTVHFNRNPNTQFFIQTSNPKHYIFRSLFEPDRFYRTTLNSRQKLGYPPYSHLLRYTFCHPFARIAEEEAKRVTNLLNDRLTKSGKTGILTGPYELQPKYYRGKYWYGIMIKFQGNNWQEDILAFNANIPAGWKIDINPLSLLNP